MRQRCVYLGLLVEQVDGIGFGTGVDRRIVFFAFGGGEAVAHGVVAVAARKGVLDIVAGVYDFAARVIIPILN